MEDRFVNQKELLNGDILAGTRFVVVGAGAIGSFFVCGLSKMGARQITVYDFDTLEDHNFANQMYPVSQLGKPKVDALKAVASDYGDCIINTVNAPWSPDNAVDSDIVVSAVDNMDVRASLWRYYKDRAKFFIDGRMSAQVYKVFGVETSNKDACTYYEGTLHSQAQASPERCGQKSIIYTVFQVSAEMCAQVKSYLMGDYRPTAVIFDALERSVDVIHHMKREMEVFYEEKEVLPVQEIQEQVKIQSS